MVKNDKWRLLLVVAVIALSAGIIAFKHSDIKLGLDLRGGAHIVLQAKDNGATPVTPESMETLIAVLRSRVDQYGVAEPIIQKQGTNRVALDLPGISDPQAALDLIGRTAVLEFRQVLGTSPTVPAKPDRKNYESDETFDSAVKMYEEAKKNADEYVQKMKEQTPDAEDIKSVNSVDGTGYLLGKLYVSGKQLTKAETTFDQLGKAAVSITFNNEGAQLFDSATAVNIGKQIAIVLDDTVISAPVVQQRITGGQAQITGKFSTEEANRLSIMLRAGALPVDVEVLENRSVGPTLGADSIAKGIKSGLIGLGLVILFMLIYYGMLGLAADLALVVSMMIVIASLIGFNATLTLPGIAGLILTIGMAVDGNVLIYERMKEEAKMGKTYLAALESGFRKALVVIVDSNVTTILAAFILGYCGTGPIRGFAVTLGIGTVAAVFCNVVVTRSILGIMLSAKDKGIKK